MDWSEVCTRRQWRNLKNAATMALGQFQDWVENIGFTGEVQIAGGIGKADKLVMRNGKIQIMFWSYDDPPPGEQPSFKYRSMEGLPYDPIAEFKLTPEHFQEAKRRAEKQMAEEAKQKKNQTPANTIDAMREAVTELKALANSPASEDILYHITLAEDRRIGMALELMPGLGLCQTIAHGDFFENDILIQPIDNWSSDDFTEAVQRFNLSAEKLRELRKKIEAE